MNRARKFRCDPDAGRRGQPEDIAKAVVFLASDDAAWITGEQISVSGRRRKVRLMRAVMGLVDLPMQCSHWS